MEYHLKVEINKQNKKRSNKFYKLQKLGIHFYIKFSKKNKIINLKIKTMLNNKVH